MQLLALYISELVFYILLLIFTIHTIALSYHWFSYGEKRSVSMTALSVYLLGGAMLFLVMGFLML